MRGCRDENQGHGRAALGAVPGGDAAAVLLDDAAGRWTDRARCVRAGVKKGSNTRGRSSAGMPGPESATSQRSPSRSPCASGSTRMATVPPSGECWTAFSMTLCRALRRRRGSIGIGAKPRGCGSVSPKRRAERAPKAKTRTPTSSAPESSGRPAVGPQAGTGPDQRRAATPNVDREGLGGLRAGAPSEKTHVHLLHDAAPVGRRQADRCRRESSRRAGRLPGSGSRYRRGDPRVSQLQPWTAHGAGRAQGWCHGGRMVSAGLSSESRPSSGLVPVRGLATDPERRAASSDATG